MKKTYTIMDNQIILNPNSDEEQNLTVENEECNFCKLAPNTSCGNYNPNIDFPACDFFRMKDGYERVEL